MTDIRGHPPPATAPVAPVARAMDALAVAVPAIVLTVVKGSVWSNLNLFWLDLAWAPAIGCFVTAVATSRPRFVVRFLDSRLPRSLGSCSYSLYPAHLPIVFAVYFGLVGGRVTSGTPVFLALSRNPAAHDRVLRTDVRRRVRAPLPAAPWWIPLRQAISARGSRLRRWRRDA